MKSEAIKGHQGSVPEKSSSPTMPKMRKRKPASPMTHPSWGIAAKIEAMSTGIPGTKRRERNGRRIRSVRSIVKLPNSEKKIGSQASDTTPKSRTHLMR